MRCFECGSELIRTAGSVRMTRKDGGLIIFKGIPLSQCRQCGEQYIPGRWSEKIGDMMLRENELVPQEIISVPVITIG
ncbi:MAG: YgiT-type zinc finger protein [Deltaproteobacteria bacterium]|nr:YgiT-type zinc finger protein [Deltaproteobacteria bacterium]